MILLTPYALNVMINLPGLRISLSILHILCFLKIVLSYYNKLTVSQQSMQTILGVI